MKETLKIYSKVSRTIQKGKHKEINTNGKKTEKACVGVASDVGVCSWGGARGGAALSGNNGIAPQASLQLQVLQLLPQLLSFLFLLLLSVRKG